MLADAPISTCSCLRYLGYSWETRGDPEEMHGGDILRTGSRSDIHDAYYHINLMEAGKYSIAGHVEIK